MGEIAMIKIAGSAGAQADSIASIDIPEDGEIVAIFGNMNSTDAALSERATIEVSFNSTNQILSNDARGSLYTLSGLAQGGTGVIGYAVNQGHTIPFGIPVNAGERVHLHLTQSGAHTTAAEVILYVRQRGNARGGRRRR